MARHLISSGSPYEATVGFSRAVVDGPWCFVSGSVGFDEHANLPEGVEEQTRNALATIEKALEEAGFAFEDVVRCHYYITDRSYAARVMPILGAVFGDIRPAATLLVVAGLIDARMKVEVEVTAYRG